LLREPMLVRVFLRLTRTVTTEESRLLTLCDLDSHIYQTSLSGGLFLSK
jgi:hypothetical protein